MVFLENLNFSKLALFQENVQNLSILIRTLEPKKHTHFARIAQRSAAAVAAVEQQATRRRHTFCNLTKISRVGRSQPTQETALVGHFLEHLAAN